MGFNWSAFVVRAEDEAALARVIEADPKAIALPGGYARLRWDSTPDWTRSGGTIPWSTRFGEAWMFCAASASDVFAYEHGKDGAVLRSLGYDGSEGWAVIEGTPEPWEKVLFSERQLADCRQAAEDEPDEPRWEREIEAMESGRLVVGHRFPQASSDLVILVARTLGTELVR